jgi:cytochrome c biogenesis protein CcmG/thiol:disulfide interchange protein DsbE
MSDKPEASRLKLAVLLPLLIFIGVAGFFVWGLMKGNPRLIPSVLIGKPVPQFNLPPMPGATLPDGSPVPGFSSKDLKGPGIKMVSFFASWCTGCRDEHPFLMELARRKVMPIYGIAYKDPVEKSLNWLKELGNPYDRIGVDLKGRTGIDFGVYGIPETFFINEEGIIIYKYIGPLNPAAWQQQVIPALEKARKKKQAAAAQ